MWHSEIKLSILYRSTSLLKALEQRKEDAELTDFDRVSSRPTTVSPGGAGPSDIGTRDDLSDGEVERILNPDLTNSHIYVFHECHGCPVIVRTDKMKNYLERDELHKVLLDIHRSEEYQDEEHELEHHEGEPFVSINSQLKSVTKEIVKFGYKLDEDFHGNLESGELTQDGKKVYVYVKKF